MCEVPSVVGSRHGLVRTLMRPSSFGLPPERVSYKCPSKRAEPSAFQGETLRLGTIATPDGHQDLTDIRGTAGPVWLQPNPFTMAKRCWIVSKEEFPSGR